MVIPRHPGQDDDTPVKRSPSRQTQVVIALVLAVVVAFVALHLAGVFGP
jgi:hypothetical protein